MELRKTPLHGRHVALGARMVPFGGWDMPVQYTGIVDEHQAVRNHAGLFDVSHMGRVQLDGPMALKDLEAFTSNRVSRLEIGQFQYSCLPLPNGGLLDDILVGRTGPEQYQIVINAGNRDPDREWIQKHLSASTQYTDCCGTHGILALQGPDAPKLLAQIATDLNPNLGTYRCQFLSILGVATLVSRTGYTGEDGFEIYAAQNDLGPVWDALLEAGAKPCGLGCRDSLRLEAGYSLYGHELSQLVSPLEAGLGWICDLTKDFVGADVLRSQKAQGVPRELVGLRMLGRAIPRQSYRVFHGELDVGEVTSGTQSPTLGAGIALALVQRGTLTEGTEAQLEIRGRLEPAQVVSRRFYRRLF